jgi:sulfopyruvate decarboxylase subunit beta
MVHIIFDNGSLLSTGGFVSNTASGITDLAAIARGAGIPNVELVSTFYEFMSAAADAFERDDLTVIVAKVEATGPDHFGMDLKLPENAFRFERAIQMRKEQKSREKELAR